MIRIGFAAGRGGPGDRLRFWALFAAAAALAVVALAAVTAAATYDGREARNQARGPLITERPQEAVALWREAFDAVGEVPHTVVYLHPLSPGAEPPPGLSRWPAPGEVMLSPELLREGEQEGIAGRYGRHAGTIGAAGLVSPSERLAYVAPARAPGAGEREDWRQVRGFGQAYPMGEVLHERPLSHVLLTLGALTGVPALALLVVAARVGSRTRDRRSSLLQALGGTWRHRALVNLGEAALPAAAGTVSAVLPMLAILPADVRIPPTGYLLDSGDLRAAWPMALAALLLSFAVTLGVVVLLHRVERDGTATRPRSFSSRIPRWRLAGCGAGAVVVALSQYLRGTPGLVAFITGTVAMWALLPSVAAVAARRLGGALAERGFRTGRPGQLIGGRWTVAHPGVVVRLALAMVIGIGLVCQLQVWNSRLGEKAAAARASEARVGDTVLSVRSRDITPTVVDELSHALPVGSHVLVLTTDADQRGALLQGSCRALRSLGLGCPAAPEQAGGDDPRVTEIRLWHGPALRAQVAPSALRLDRLHSSLIVTSEGPGRRAEVERAAYALVPAVNVETPVETWLVGAAGKARLNNWLLLFGSLGLGLLLLAGSLSAAAEFTRVRHVLAPLAVLTGSHAIHRSVAWWHLTVPLLVSAAVAATVSAWHSVFFIAVVQEGSFSWGMLAAATGGCALLAAVVGVLGGRTAIHAAQQWRPAAD
ncbi:permease [Streptomyces sp. F63]|uniref:permease n=1 Tax=Streptomyces sp. F63 TaxID=2824887 RepID=UPI001B38A069|nr:permease [Streptomyces sp. F63]MBQ0986053.1 permease [Streptomyces sp. F63]